MVLVDVGQLFRCAGQQSPPPPQCQWTPHANAPPPRLERRNMAPLATPSRRKKHPPPRDFFTKSHTHCPFLPSFLSVQWHVMGTILGVMCLVFNVDFHFSKFFCSFLLHCKVPQCLTAIVINSWDICIPTHPFLHCMLTFWSFGSLPSQSPVPDSLLRFCSQGGFFTVFFCAFLLQCIVPPTCLCCSVCQP